jgi:hypothetical protein
VINKRIKMAKIIITQSILWAAAIISSALVAPSDSGWLLLTVLATLSIGTLKSGIGPLARGQDK